MAFITTYNKSKFNNKHTLSENTWFNYPYIYNVVGGNNVLNVYRKDIINKTSELYGTIDTSNALDWYTSEDYTTVYGSTRSENTNKMYIILGRRINKDTEELWLFSLDLVNLTYKKIFRLNNFKYNTAYYDGHYVVKEVNENKLLLYLYYCYGSYNSTYYFFKPYVYYKVIEVNFVNGEYTTRSELYSTYATDEVEELSYTYGNIFATIVDVDYKFLKYGVKTQSGSYIAKAGFTYYENPSSYDLYNLNKYNGGLILEFNNKYYVIGGYINANVNTNILELNKDTLEATLVYETTATSNIYMPYVYGNSMYIVYTDGTDDYLLTVTLAEYNLNYGIKSNNGEKVYVELLNNTPIKAITFNNLSGTNTVEYVIETLSDTLQGSFVIDEIENKQLSGFSTIINSTSIQIPLNKRVVIDISIDTNFYTVYSTYRPLANTFKLELYNNTSEDNRVDKTNYLTKIGELAGVLREESSLIDMTLTLEIEELPLFNYVYIAQLNRYYYVTDIVSIKYKLWTISLSVDVLMSYKNALLSCIAFVDRNENSFDNNIIDKKRVIEQGYDIEVSTITNELLNDNVDYNYILTGFYTS